MMNFKKISVLCFFSFLIGAGVSYATFSSSLDSKLESSMLVFADGGDGTGPRKGSADGGDGTGPRKAKATSDGGDGTGPRK